MKAILLIFVLAFLGSEAVAQGTKSQAWMKFANATTQDTIATTGVDSLSYRIEKTWDGGVVQVILDKIGSTAIAGTVALWGSTNKGATWATVPLNGTATAQSYSVTNTTSQSTFFHVSPMIYTNLRVVITGSGSGSYKAKALVTVGSGG